MALKANRNGAVTAPTQNAMQENEIPFEKANVPVVATTAKSVAVAKHATVVDLNSGILEGMEDIGGGNYVSLDGAQFLYKSRNENVDEIDMIVAFGKKFYQYVDDTDPDNKRYHNSDTKLDDRYKLKFELRWMEADEEDESTEYTMTLSTTSAMNCIDYVKRLAGAGYGVGQVITQMTTSRQSSRDGKNRYYRVEFEAFTTEGKPLNIKTK
jgi:hypothetical protein